MGAIQRNNFRFVPEYSVINQNGAVHVYQDGEFKEELTFTFEGKYPNQAKIESIVDDYCEQYDI
ncbi:YbxH family protein [Aquibacillus sediminis]|uniref:YbxH family protein n=1 Tax=Aquibacillus sediminis TaxID=2574734 RepID=UPI0011086BDA|nr:YbxH family protein [Aquibacillus sediminis]